MLTGKHRRLLRRKGTGYYELWECSFDSSGTLVAHTALDNMVRSPLPKADNTRYWICAPTGGVSRNLEDMGALV